VFPNAARFIFWNKMSDADNARLGIRLTHSTPLKQLPEVARYYRSLSPVMPLAIRSRDVFDAVLSILHAVARGIRVRPGQVLICLGLSPMRCAWDLREQYFRESRFGDGVHGAVVRRRRDVLRRWVASISASVTTFVAISENIADRIRRSYGRDATVFCTSGGHRTFQSRRRTTDGGLRNRLPVRALQADPSDRSCVFREAGAGTFGDRRWPKRGESQTSDAVECNAGAATIARGAAR
jgi:hypothetical protein